MEGTASDPFHLVNPALGVCRVVYTPGVDLYRRVLFYYAADYQKPYTPYTLVLSGLFFLGKTGVGFQSNPTQPYTPYIPPSRATL